MQSRNFAMATAAAGVLCLCIALVQVTDMAGTRRAAALQIGSQFQRGDAANSHIVPLPNAGEIGTNKAFMGKADGSGQSTMDTARFQALAAKHAQAHHAKWHPNTPAQLGYKLHKMHKKGKKNVPTQHLAQAPVSVAQGNIYAHLAGNDKPQNGAKKPELWPGTVIGQAPEPGQQKAQTWQNIEDAGPMGTNGVFLGAHQGGDSGFSNRPLERVAWDSMQGKARFAAVPVLYQQQQGAQLWPASVVGQAPQQDTRRKYPQTAADGSLIY